MSVSHRETTVRKQFYLCCTQATTPTYDKKVLATRIITQDRKKSDQPNITFLTHTHVIKIEVHFI